MSCRKRMKDAIDFNVFMGILKSMSKDEFEDYICELKDLYYVAHPELEEEDDYDICRS